MGKNVMKNFEVLLLTFLGENNKNYKKPLNWSLKDQHRDSLSLISGAKHDIAIFGH